VALADQLPQQRIDKRGLAARLGAARAQVAQQARLDFAALARPVAPLLAVPDGRGRRPRRRRSRLCRRLALAAAIAAAAAVVAAEVD
jgi:hypothetical protein